MTSCRLEIFHLVSTDKRACFIEHYRYNKVGVLSAISECKQSKDNDLNAVTIQLNDATKTLMAINKRERFIAPATFYTKTKREAEKLSGLSTRSTLCKQGRIQTV